MHAFSAQSDALYEELHQRYKEDHGFAVHRDHTWGMTLFVRLDRHPEHYRRDIHTSRYPRRAIVGGHRSKLADEIDRKAFTEAFMDELPGLKDVLTVTPGNHWQRIARSNLSGIGLVDFGEEGYYGFLRQSASAQQTMPRETLLGEMEQFSQTGTKVLNAIHPEPRHPKEAERTMLLMGLLGWKGGTVHQLNRELGTDIHSLSDLGFRRLIETRLVTFNAPSGTLGVAGRFVGRAPLRDASQGLRDIQLNDFASSHLGLDPNESHLQGVFERAVPRVLAEEIMIRTPEHLHRTDMNRKPATPSPAPAESFDGPSP